MTSKEEIAKHIKELEEAMVENMKAREAEDAAKIRKQKAHYQLSSIQDRIRHIQYD